MDKNNEKLQKYKLYSKNHISFPLIYLSFQVHQEES
jgi:hypothetical protein